MITKRSPSLNSELAATWHLEEISEIVAKFETSITQGLSTPTARQNAVKYGKNILPKAKPRSHLVVFLSYFWSIPVALLTLAAILAVITGSQVDALVIMGVVVINAILGYVTESKSERIILSLQNIVNPTAWVIRDGLPIEVESQTITLGDLLILKPGSYIAADARVIKSDRLKVDESTLTGESHPITKTSRALLKPEVPLAERNNMVYGGTFVTGGEGLGVVVATGQQTEMGKIQALVAETKIPHTPLEIQLEQAGTQLVLLSSGICILVLALGILRGYGFVEMLQTSIALAVAAVPEGLPTVATITLALGINRMRQQGVLVRRLDAIEALGSVQTICLDKTGTLTTNKMSVVEIQTLERKIELAGSKFTGDAELLQLAKIAVLCNESEVDRDENDRIIIDGSTTENALIQMAIDLGLDVTAIRTSYPLVNIGRRADGLNYMTTVHRVDRSARFVAVKGNPLEVLALCQYKQQDDTASLLTTKDRQAIACSNQEMSGNALRVLGVAYSKTSTAKEIALDNLIWLGLIGIINPIRQGVKELIANFHRAGIDTVMLTGDQENTALAIAKQLNFNNVSNSSDPPSTNLAPKTVGKSNVFARVTPADKLKIVRAFQAAGKVVAMTGDGINDAPALKAAEVGIAMGKTGTDVAREVADIVLADDNLETAIAAVSQGRTIVRSGGKKIRVMREVDTERFYNYLLEQFAR